jgi:hypothetical protein
MTYDSRIELLESLRPAYTAGSWKDKVQILNNIVSATGYSRKHATRLLAGSLAMPTCKRHRQKTYNDQIHAHVRELWLAANRICSKRLVALIPTLLRILEEREYLKVSDFDRAQLLSISAATIDRMLREDRKEYGPRKRHVSHANSLRKQIPVRTMWDNPAAGFCEIDLVSHGGQSASGQFLQTLTLTDIATGWTENKALLTRTDENALSAIKAAVADFPIPLLGLDCDNGGEFLNHLLDNHCKDEVIELTRCRQYQKNDQAHVEQKNGNIVRRLVGYDRFEGEKSLALMRTLYTVSRLYNNYFQPSFKLLSKVRIASKVIKKYDKPNTPYQRILNDSAVSQKTKQTLSSVFDSLDPVQLLQSMQTLQGKLWQTALSDPDAQVQTITMPKLSRTKTPHKNRPRKPLPHCRPGKKRNTELDLWIWRELDLNPALGLLAMQSFLVGRYSGTAPSNKTVYTKMNEWRDKHPEYAHLYHRSNRRSNRTKSLETG